MWTRRSVLRLAGSATGAAFAARSYGIDYVAAATAAVENRSPEDVAADETYWREIQMAFTLDRSMINLNNGNSCPSPTVVHEAYKRYLDSSNQAPVYHRSLIERNIETARRRLAAEFGADPEEIAITRNASESLQIAQMGLDLKPGDEIVTTEQDYGRMLTTWDQRARRDKIKVTRLDFPCPTTQADLYQRFEKAITPQTKVLHFCHITNQSGQLFPGSRSQPDGAPARHHHHRRRRPRAGALPVQAARPGDGLLRRQPAQVAARAARHRPALRPQGSHRVDLAAAGGARAARHRHPQVRGNRHQPRGHQGGDQRGDRLPAGDRHRTQGGAAALPDAAMGERAEEAPEDQAALEPRARTDVGPGGRLHRRRRLGQARDPPVGQVAHRHRGCRARQPEGSVA